MPDTPQLLVFASAAVVLFFIPGPAVLYITARSIHQGRAAGLVSCAGIGAGTIFHVVAAAAGLSALLVRSVIAFQVVKYLGAAYLIWLGIHKLTEREEVAEPEMIRFRTLRSVFLQGVVVNLLNPKTALFFFAFLPQFVDPGRGAVAGQVLFLGGLFIALGFLCDATWALAAGTVGHWLRSHLGFVRAQRWFAGGVYLTLGLAAAVTPGRSK